MRTHSDGTTTLASDCFTDGGSIIYPDWTFTVSAPGYQRAGPLSMKAYTGALGKKDHQRMEVGLAQDRDVK